MGDFSPVSLFFDGTELYLVKTYYYKRDPGHCLKILVIRLALRMMTCFTIRAGTIKLGTILSSTIPLCWTGIFIQ